MREKEFITLLMCRKQLINIIVTLMLFTTRLLTMIFGLMMNRQELFIPTDLIMFQCQLPQETIEL